MRGCGRPSRGHKCEVSNIWSIVLTRVCRQRAVALRARRARAKTLHVVVVHVEHLADVGQEAACFS